MKCKVAFVTGNPNWHCPEFYQKMASHPRIDLIMYFLSQDALNGSLLRQAFGVNSGIWGVELLKGYRYKFLKNYSPLRPEFNKTKVFSYLNFGVWNEIKKNHYHAVVITMWNDLGFWLAAIACRFSNTPFLFAGDSTILTEKAKSKWKRVIIRIFLGKILFPLASGFLYRTELNRQFYRYYGVPEEHLFFYPLSVDYKGLSKVYNTLHGEKENLRSKYKIPKEAFVILFVGRLSEEKRPLDLLTAYAKSKTMNKVLVVVGDGKLKKTLRDFAKQKCIKNIYFFGFRPRTEVLNFYALSDMLVLPSGYEPHGDVVKEAMCFGLPIIVSDKVGASEDLVKHGGNGFVYPCGDTEMLASYIDELSNKRKRTSFGKKSLDIVRDWGHDKAINGLIEALDSIYKERS